jgi:hypothetical protein
MRKQLVVCLVCAVALIGAASARATPNTTQYDNPATSSPAASNATVSGAKTAPKATSTPKASTTAPAPTTVTTSKQTLPFTGLALLAYVFVGGALVVLGLGLRRAATSRARD